MESSSLELKKNSIKGIFLTIIILSCLFSGIIAYFVNSFMYSNQINNLEHKISQLEQQLDSITTNISGNTNEYPVLLCQNSVDHLSIHCRKYHMSRLVYSVWPYCHTHNRQPTGASTNPSPRLQPVAVKEK